MTEVRITVRNTSETGGTFLTPFFFGFHDGSFDIYNLNQAASAGLEALAEDGDASGLIGELTAADGDAQNTSVVGSGGPIATGETASAIFDVDGVSNAFASFAAMLLPSNDAFVGTADALQLFDAAGNFLGEQTVVFDGMSVRDAGTEVNTEEDAAFLNQLAPNTGVDQNGVVTTHAGFNGSVGNPVGEGAQNILGGTNAAGEFIDPDVADFTLSGAQIATVHINAVVTHTGTDGRDKLFGGADDDIIDAGAGRDLLFGRKGWDVLSGGDDRDLIFGGDGDDELDGGAGRDNIKGGKGNDIILGGDDNDRISGASGDDVADGGDGNDIIRGGKGNDIIAGGEGNDRIHGGKNDDTFLYVDGDGRDTYKAFDRNGDDKFILGVTGIDDFQDVMDIATQARGGVEIDFGGGDVILLKGTQLSMLDEGDFMFA